MSLILGAVWIVVLGGVGYWIAQQKRRSEVEGAALGCLLGPLGWIIEAVLPTGEMPSAPVTRSSDSTSSSSARNQDPPRPGHYALQALYVPYDFVLDPEGSRKPKGPDGPPPGWLKFDEKTPTANLIASMSGAELYYFHERGYRVVEAVWKPGIGGRRLRRGLPDRRRHHDHARRREVGVDEGFRGQHPRRRLYVGAVVESSASDRDA